MSRNVENSERNEIMGINSVHLAGNATRDAEVRATQSGNYAVRLGLAVDAYRSGEKVADFFNLTAFAKSERQMQFYASVKKGDKLSVEGELRNNVWTGKDGKEHREVEIIVREVFKLASSQAEPPQVPERSNIDDGVYDEEIPF